MNFSNLKKNVDIRKMVMHTLVLNILFIYLNPNIFLYNLPDVNIGEKMDDCKGK